MITFITTGAHQYCAVEIEDMPGAPRIECRSYNWLFRQKRLRRQIYIFSDFDRLSTWQIELAARAFRHLRHNTATVLNDPAQALQRLPLLRQLHRRGFNRFDVWDAAADTLPDRYPDFLRTRSAHRGVIGDLLESKEAAERALADAVDKGFGLHDLMFVEYCAQPLANGIFRKLAAFRIGGTIQMALAVHERHWIAKYGEEGVAGQALYDEEFAFVDTNPYAAHLKAAFDIANIDYGRADFTVVDGAPQIYEINTNPHISIIQDHPFPVRVRAQQLFSERFVKALQAIPEPSECGEWIDMDAPELVEQRRIDRLVARERWTI